MMNRITTAMAAMTAITLAGLIGGCAQPQPKRESWLSRLLPDLGSPAPVEIARNAFNQHDPDVRRRSVSRLAAAPFGGEPPYVRLYRMLLDDSDATVRAAAAHALARHGRVEDAVRLADLLEDDSAYVRWAAARGLRRIHNPRVIDPLLTRLSEDSDADARMAAADALGQYAQPRVFHALVGALNDRVFSIAQAAHRSLITLTGRRLGYDSGVWIRWGRDHAGELFAQRRAYTFQPYDAPPNLLEKVRFWEKEASPAPRQPVGVEVADQRNQPADRG